MMLSYLQYTIRIIVIPSFTSALSDTSQNLIPDDELLQNLTLPDIIWLS